MIFSLYRKNCEVRLDYPKIGGDDVIEDYEKRLSETFFTLILMYIAED